MNKKGSLNLVQILLNFKLAKSEKKRTVKRKVKKAKKSEKGKKNSRIVCPSKKAGNKHKQANKSKNHRLEEINK